jgi:hypothetical protein
MSSPTLSPALNHPVYSGVYTTSSPRFDHGGELKAEPKPAEQPEPENNPLRKGLVRYWGYINEVAEAFAPQLKKAFPINPLGKDLVSWWSYRLVDVYASLDGLATTYRSWKDNADQKPFPRVWNALTEGAGAWSFQQLASVYLPATVVSGVRKGADSALNHTPLKPLNGKHGLDWLLAMVEGPVSAATRQTLVASKNLPGLKALLARPGAKLWVPTVLATATIPFIIKPIDKLSEGLVNRTIKPTMDGLGRLFGIDRQTNPVTPTPNVLAHRAHKAFNDFEPKK